MHVSAEKRKERTKRGGGGGEKGENNLITSDTTPIAGLYVITLPYSYDVTSIPSTILISGSINSLHHTR